MFYSITDPLLPLLIQSSKETEERPSPKFCVGNSHKIKKHVTINLQTSVNVLISHLQFGMLMKSHLNLNQISSLFYLHVNERTEKIKFSAEILGKIMKIAEKYKTQI